MSVAVRRFLAPIPSRVIWIHAVSVGETRAAEPLIKALRAQHPEYRSAVARHRPGARPAWIFAGVHRCYLPTISLGFARLPPPLRSGSRHLHGTEIWPNLIGPVPIVVYLVNARMSEKSARGIGGWKSARRTLSAIGHRRTNRSRRAATEGPRGQESALGNIKFDRLAPAEMLALAPFFAIYLARDLSSLPRARAKARRLVLDALAGRRAWATDCCRATQRLKRSPPLFDSAGTNFSSQRKSSDQNSNADCPRRFDG